MIKIGRYGIAFGRVFWIQTRVPTKVWHFLYFWFFKQVKPADVDVYQVNNKQRFLIGNMMEKEGRKYYYCKASEPIVTEETQNELEL